MRSITAVLPLLLLLPAGCKPGLGEVPSDVEDTAIIAEELDPGTDLILDMTLEPSELVPTVATLRWRTATPMNAYVTIMLDGEPPRRMIASETPQTLHEAVLLGIPEGYTATFVVEVFDKTISGESQEMTYEAGMLDPDIPRPMLSGTQPPLTEGGFFVTTIMKDNQYTWLAILDPAGRLVWAMQDIEHTGHRARLLPDGSGVAWLWWRWKSPEGGIHAARFDGTQQWRVSANTLHQDFDFIDSQTALILGWEEVEQETDEGPITLFSDRVVKVQSDGEITEVWRLLDDVPYAPTSGQRPSTQVPGTLDWAHVNHLDLHDGVLYMTALNLNAVMTVDPATWQLTDLIEGNPEGGDPLFDAPHSAWPTPDGLLMLSHREPQGEDQCSEVFTIQADAQGATRSSTLPVEDCYHLDYLGNAQPLPGGDVLVDWSHMGILSAISSDGLERRDLRLPMGGFFGYAEWVPGLGSPFNQ
jgi:hypothetical protein